MDVLRTGCSMFGTLEPESSIDDQYKIADRLIATFPGMLTYWYHFQRNGKRIETEVDDEDVAGQFLHLLHGKKPDALHRRAVDVSLILYAEHEFNASTFSRVSQQRHVSDFYSAITSAIEHYVDPYTGANEAAMELIEKFKTADEAEAGLRKMLSEKALIMGFGHRVYTVSDPRSDIIKSWSKKLADAAGDKFIIRVSEVDRKMMWMKNIYPQI